MGTLVPLRSRTFSRVPTSKVLAWNDQLHKGMVSPPAGANVWALIWKFFPIRAHPCHPWFKILPETPCKHAS